MFDFLFVHENAVYSIVFTVMVIIGLLELLSILIGQSMSGLLDNLLPDGHHIHLDSDTDVGALFNWFYVGKLPFLMLLVSWMMSFSATGLLLNEVILPLFSMNRMSMGIGVLVTGLICLIPFHFIASFVHFIMPKDETTAFNLEELVDHTGVIVIGGSNDENHQVQIKVQVYIDGKREKVQTHYVMGILSNENKTINDKGEVLLLDYLGNGVFSYRYK